MRLSTPQWWYERHPTAPRLRAFMTPLSWIWAAATARRLAHGRPTDPGAAVICVGNLTLGGAGKTPVARAIALRLSGRGAAVHLLSRGYGGRLAGPIRVDPSRHTSTEVGDEPLMLAGDLPVWIARDRRAGAAAAVEGGARVVVMDDGHQNPAVLKALSLVVVDGETRGDEWPFGDGRVFPAGPLREPLAAGLARADAAVILLPADLAAPDAGLLAELGSRPVLIAHLEPAEPPPSGPQMGFAGVGKPWKVERALKAAGCKLVDFAAFPDHFVYDEAVLQRLVARAAELGAGLVTTEKDWVRLPASWRSRIVPWRVTARFDDPAALDALLLRAGL